MVRSAPQRAVTEGASDMAGAETKNDFSIWPLIGQVLGPERPFYVLAAIYGAGVSLLSLAVPVSVQMLINTVANTGLATPLFVLSGALFGLLLVSGLLSALRLHLMELFGRRFYARFFSEATLRTVYARNPFFQDMGRSELFNRYFDIMTMQRSVPYLLIGAYTILLQAVVGFVVVSFYHPFFFVFSVVFVTIVALIWMIWGGRAIRTGIALSHAKYDAARWLQSLGASNGFYKTDRRLDSALDAADEATARYVDAHKRHFRSFFAQTVSLYVLYAGASAALLGLGGWLVIQSELTLGQLVAAELILSAVFLGVSQLGSYLTVFYDLCAAAEELHMFYDVSQEEKIGEVEPGDAPAELVFDRVVGEARGGEASLTLTVPAGARVLASASDHGLQRLFTHLLKRHVTPRSGWMGLGGADIADMDAHRRRQEMIVLDRPTIVDVTIRDYLALAAPSASPEQTTRILELTGLRAVVAALPDGLDSRLASNGWPLSLSETMMLKLAGALLARPRILILTQLFDAAPQETLARVLAAVRDDPCMTLIYFSNRPTQEGFDLYLHLGRTRQRTFESYDAFRRACADGGDVVRLAAPTDTPTTE